MNDYNVPTIPEVRELLMFQVENFISSARELDHRNVSISSRSHSCHIAGDSREPYGVDDLEHIKMLVEEIERLINSLYGLCEIDDEDRWVYSYSIEDLIIELRSPVIGEFDTVADDIAFRYRDNSN